MLTAYLCGALVVAMAALGCAIWISDLRTEVSPVDQAAVAFLAGVLWPVVALGAVLLGGRGLHVVLNFALSKRPGSRGSWGFPIASSQRSMQ
ncbi:MAG: hypothetical protein K0U84_00965 [Actinomycetia bacterium]|nr:hypothetical protein [Actinomycetes bacterium]